MEEIKVSVIIPVYNTADYVRQAVESILQQTLQELEVIIVNDGSTDGSGVILHELARQDERIQIVEQENQGQSVARNNGVALSTGKYLYFMDSDDLLEADALELCLCKCEEHALDFVLFDADILNSTSILTKDLIYERSHCVREDKIYGGPEIIQILLNNWRFTPSPCLLFIRRDCLQEKSIGFYPGIIHEDQLFSSLLYLQAERVMYICRRFFKRRLREGSTMTSRFLWRNMEGYLTVARELLRFRSARPKYIRKIIDLLLRQMLTAAVWQAHVLPLSQRLDLLCICLRRYRSYVSNRALGALLFKKMIQR